MCRTFNLVVQLDRCDFKPDISDIQLAKLQSAFSVSLSVEEPASFSMWWKQKAFNKVQRAALKAFLGWKDVFAPDLEWWNAKNNWKHFLLHLGKMDVKDFKIEISSI